MAEPDPAVETLLLHLRDSRGFDFTGYKRSSPMRRVDRRMAQVGCAELWGLRPEETIGRHFLSLDIGLPLEQLAPLIRRALGGNQDGRSSLCPRSTAGAAASMNACSAARSPGSTTDLAV